MVEEDSARFHPSFSHRREGFDKSVKVLTQFPSTGSLGITDICFGHQAQVSTHLGLYTSASKVLLFPILPLPMAADHVRLVSPSRLGLMPMSHQLQPDDLNK